MSNSELFEIGSVLNEELIVEHISEYDNGYSRNPSHRIIFSDKKGNRYEWETSGKFELIVGEKCNTPLKIKKHFKDFDGKLIIILKRQEFK